MAEENTNMFEAATQTDAAGESFLEKYVGDGKKYKDVEELAKAYDNANAFIPTLKSDLDGMKDFIRAQFGELARNNTATNNQPNPNPDRNDSGNEPPNLAPTPNPQAGDEAVDLNERIKAAMRELSQEDRARTNAQITEEAMLKHYGSKDGGVEAIRAKAAELGVNPKFLADTAFQSPTAFFNLMGISEEAPRSNSTPASSSDVNPQRLGANVGVKPGTYAYYDQIRRTDPRRYASQELQQQLMADAMKMGNDFFKR